MANYTSYPGDDRAISESGGQNAAGFPCVDVIQAEYDSSLLNLVASDTVEIADLPAGAKVLSATIEVLTLEAATSINLGTTADPDGFVAVGSGASAGMVDGAGALVDVLQTATTKVVAEVPAATADWTVLKFRVALTVAFAD